MGLSGRQRTRLAALFITAALAFHSGPARAAGCQYQNLMPAFLAFEQQTKALPPARRAQLFADDFAPRHPDFYGEMGHIEGYNGLPPKDRLTKDALRLLDPANMETLPGFTPLTQERFEAAARATDADFSQAQMAFARTFPNLQCPASITFGPSFLHFDGHVYYDGNGRQHMMFGVDALAVEHRPADMPALYAHELFHIYHRQALGRAFLKGDRSSVLWSMWFEGLATYVSRQMNPALSLQQALAFPSDLVDRMQAPGVEQNAARLMLADLDASNPAWFDTTHTITGLPPRAGYYMGYALAASLGRHYSLDQLAHLQPEQVKIEARKFFAAQAKAG